MGSTFLRFFRGVPPSALLKPTPFPLSSRSIVRHRSLLSSSSSSSCPLAPPSSHPLNPSWVFRNMSHGSVNLVFSQGQAKFEALEIDPPKKEKWQTKKRFKTQKRKEKQKRKSANKRDPRHLGVKGNNKNRQRFLNAEERIKSKLQKARIKEGLLIERLKRYEVPKLQGPVVKPDNLTGEERFYMKKMGQKRRNYVEVGKRGVFGGVILNMHLHWKKHETVKVFCKPCKPGQVQEYAQEIARLSGGTPIQIIGDDTIIFYRGKDYVQPEVMSPIDTLSKKRALQKAKYEQSLETVKRFIAISEKELELYYRHVAMYGDPNDRNPISILDGPKKSIKNTKKFAMGKQALDSTSVHMSSGVSSPQPDFSDQELSTTGEDSEDEDLCMSQLDAETNDLFGSDSDPSDEESEDSSGLFDSESDLSDSESKESAETNLVRLSTDAKQSSLTLMQEQVGVACVRNDTISSI